MTAVTFTLTDLETGRWLGLAVICVEARYASVRWRDTDRFDRRFGPPAVWRSVEVELRPGFETGPLPAECGVVRLLVDQDWRRSVVVQYVTATPVLAAPNTTVEALDHVLRAGRGA